MRSQRARSPIIRSCLASGLLLADEQARNGCCSVTLQLRGIVNGIDYAEWSPEVDPFLTADGYKNYSLKTMKQGKAACKAALQKQLGLPVKPDAPMLGFIGRLDYQKGVDFIRDSFEWLMGEGVQLVMLGSGRADLEEALRDMEGRCGGDLRIRVRVRVNPQLMGQANTMSRPFHRALTHEG